MFKGMGVGMSVKNSNQLSFLFLIFITFILTCEKKNSVSPVVTTGRLTDIDGNTYQTIKIGNQWWMAENLKVTCFRNGEAIPKHSGGEDWLDLTTSTYCAYGNDEKNATRYGYLYNWFVTQDSRKIAPVGWHVPSDAEWKELEMHLGMSQQEADMTVWRGVDEEGGQLKDSRHWNDPNVGATNASGFNAIGSGYRCGGFHSLGETASYWTSSEKSRSSAWGRGLTNYESRVFRDEIDKEFAYSIRCVKD